MYIQPPDCKVINFGFNFNNLHIKGQREYIDLRGLNPYIVISSQPGMITGKGNRELVYAPAELRAGGQPKKADDSLVDELQKLPPIEQNAQYPLRQLIFILDRSSSMANRLSLVQEQIADLGPHLKNLLGLKISLVSFDQSGKVELTYVDNYGQIVRNVQELKLGSGTDMLSGLKVAYDVLTNFEGFDLKGTERNLWVFITDGMHREALTLPKVFELTYEMATKGNSIGIISGVGTAYSPFTNRTIAGHASSSAWSHIASSVGDKALKKLGQSDFFGKFLPGLLRQITGNDYFIRVDAEGIAKAWSVDPSVYENRLPMDKKGKQFQQLGPAIWNSPSYICFSRHEDTEPCFTVTSQERILPEPDSEVIEPVEVVNFNDLLDPELRLRSIFLARKFLLSLALQSEAPDLLTSMNKVGLLKRDQLRRYQDLIDRAQKNQAAAQEELYDESSSTGNESLASFSGMQAELAKFLGEEAVPEAAGYNLQKALFDLDRNLGGKPSPKESLAGISPDIFNAEEVNIGGIAQNIDAHSGGLGPPDEPPDESLKPFQAGAVEAYNVAQSPNVTIRINVGDLNEATEGVFIRPGSDLAQKTVIKIGRELTNQVIIDDKKASKKHCIIFRQGDDFSIQDLNSQNGTYVNGEDISGKGIVPLNHGDIVRIASEAFVVRFKEEDNTIQPLPVISIPKENRSGSIRVMPLSLFKKNITVGREMGCDVIINDEKVSRVHCRIINKDEGYKIVDIGSTNGTYINGNRIAQGEETPINNGDIVLVGRSIFEVVINK